MEDKDPDSILTYLIQKLNSRKVAFLEMAEGLGIGMENDINAIKNRFNERFKSQFKGTWISGFGYT
jgi:hypothetical protein